MRSVAELIEWGSSFYTLHPGDVMLAAVERVGSRGEGQIKKPPRKPRRLL
jgi:hypothetical protein